MAKKNDLLSEPKLNKLLEDNESTGGKLSKLYDYIKEEKLNPEDKEYMDHSGYALYVRMDNIIPSLNNMNYYVNIKNFEQAGLILKELLEIDADLLERSSEYGSKLTDALTMEKGTLFTQILNKYQSHPGALKLLALAGSIKQHGLMHKPPCREILGARPHEAQFSLIGGMRRYLAMKLLQEEWITIWVLSDKNEDAEHMLSVVENLQRETTPAEKYGEQIADMIKRHPEWSQAQIASKLGISQASVSRFHDRYTKGLEPKKEKEKTINQVLFDQEGFKFVFTGKEKLSAEDVNRIRELLNEIVAKRK